MFHWRASLSGGSILVLLLLTGLLYTHFEREREDQALVTHTYQVLNAARGLMAYLDQAESGQRSYLLTADSSYLASLESALEGEESDRRLLRC